MPVPPLAFSASTNAAIDRYNAEGARVVTPAAAALAASIREMAAARTSVRLEPAHMNIAAGTLLQIASALDRGTSVARVTQVLANTLALHGLSAAQAQAAAQAILSQIQGTMFFADPAGGLTQFIVRV